MNPFKPFKSLLSGLTALTLLTQLSGCMLPYPNLPVALPDYQLEAADKVDQLYHENQLYNVSASPDGRYVFYGLKRHQVASFRAPSTKIAYSPESQNFYLYDTQSQITHTLDKLSNRPQSLAPLVWNTQGELILSEYDGVSQESLFSFDPVSRERKLLFSAQQLIYQLVGDNLYLRRNQSARIEKLNLSSGELSNWLEVPLDAYQDFKYRVDSDSLSTVLHMQRSFDKTLPDPSQGFKVAMCGCARPPKPATDWYLVDAHKNLKALPAFKNLSDGFLAEDQEVVAGDYLLQKVYGRQGKASVYVFHIYDIESGKAVATLNGQRAWELSGSRLLVQSHEDVALYDLKTLQVIQKLALPQAPKSETQADFATYWDVAFEPKGGRLLVSNGHQAGMIKVADAQLTYQEVTRTDTGNLHLGQGSLMKLGYGTRITPGSLQTGQLKALVIDGRPGQDAEVWLPGASGFGPGMKIPVAKTQISYTPDETLWSLR